MKTKNSKIIALKQSVAFLIDLTLISLPLIIAPSLESFPIFALLWFLYIPLSEYYFSQTFGMKFVGTHIYSSADDKTQIMFGTVARRQIARISMVWGVVGWILMFLGKQYVSDYVITDKNYRSIELDEKGLVVAHQNNQYKVIFFAFVLMAILSILQEAW